MKALFTLLMVCCLSLLGAQNRTVEIAGRVFYGSEGNPARSVPVNFYTEDGVRTVNTDAEGHYRVSVPLFIPPTGYVKAAVEVRDICTGQILSRILAVSTDSLVFRNVNFTLCQNVNPPPPPQTCQSFFTHKPAENDPKTILFKDLSYANTPIIKWAWDFGDATTSNEQNPRHTYARNGVYIVSLTITSRLRDSTLCTAAFRASVYVTDSSSCNCTREYLPVCVKNEQGAIITFPNKCLAICAGYSEFEIGNCIDSTCVCPAVYAPVCVRTADGTILEFGNACEAACKGYTERDFVECQRDTCDCPTDEYVPVCVVVNGDTLTYGNACRAKCAGFQESDFVQCDTTGGCFCPEYYEPVCVISANGDTLTFSNKCFAYCAGYSPEDIFDCRPGGCGCPAVYDPVCVKTADGTIQQFGNACEAKCAGYAITDLVPCDTTGCNCPKILEPVCAIGPNGDTLTFTNRCFAVCEGYNPEQLFQCRPNDCICPPVIDPVCVRLADGNIIRYNSKCEALCNGFKETDIVACDSSSCVCPEYYDPVCVVVNGDTLTFDNPCFARCKGFTERDWFRCGRRNDCACPLNLDPVCVKVDGYIKEFPNACVAKCYGFTERDFVPCERDTSDCVCPLYYAPVCVLGPNGDTITFSNPCFAACAGYSDAQLIRCNGNEGGDPNTQCAASFNFSMRDSLSLTVAFQSLTRTLEGTVTNWKWDFGDGNVSDQQNPVHTYRRGGLYNVTLSIVASTGCYAITTRSVYVAGGNIVGSSMCQAAFLFRQDESHPNKITFRNLSNGNADSWQWDFGDGYTSTERDPVHTYAYNGVFFVRLTMRAGDCVNTTSMVLFIDPNAVYENNCNALFLPVLFVDSLQVAFRNMSSPDATEFKWDFGDGTTSAEFAPLHTYGAKGIYEITLTITTRNGCTNTFRAVLNLGNQNFTGNPEYRVNLTDVDDVKVLRDLKLYPNPVKGEAMLEFNTMVGGSYLLQIFSLEGKLLQTQRDSAQAGKNNIPFTTNNLPAGMYLLRLQTAGQTQSVKFIKQ
ncbi:MAG: PKD domain-containing protein [Saprospiraceae bacterium]